VTTVTGIVCLYFGRPDECRECGGFNETGDPYCSHDCADSAAARAAEADEAVRSRRAREEAFAVEGARLRALGHSDEEIDVLLADMPT
jgi:hypothetical protein